jgi:hypothetical protein
LLNAVRLKVRMDAAVRFISLRDSYQHQVQLVGQVVVLRRVVVATYK